MFVNSSIFLLLFSSDELLFVFNDEISSFNFWISICNVSLSKSLISNLLFNSVICSIKKLFFSYKLFISFSLLSLFSCNFLLLFNSLFKNIFSLFKFSIFFSNSLFLFLIFSNSFSKIFCFSNNCKLLLFKFLFLFSFSLLLSFNFLFSFFNSFKFSFNWLICNL